MGKATKDKRANKNADKDISNIIDKVISGKVKKKKSPKTSEVPPNKVTAREDAKKLKKKSKTLPISPKNNEPSIATNEKGEEQKLTVNDKPDPEKKLRHDSKPENTIFVGNLPANTKKKQLNALFAKYGKIISIRFRTNDGKKLFKHATRKKAESLNAYVVFEAIESKEQALALSGMEYKGKHIRVTGAKDVTSEAEPKRLIFVGNLKYSATDEKLYDIFSTCGEIDYVRTIRNEKGCSGVAYVCYKKPESILLALDLNDTMLDERPIRVQRYHRTAQQSAVAANMKSKKLTGSARRVMEKAKKSNKLPGKKGRTDKADNQPKVPRKEKKSDYRGVKITTIKKKAKNKKKPSHLQKLAKKIAPK